jgi:hypothetical protein
LTAFRFYVRISIENSFQLETLNINTDQLSHELATRGHKLTAPRRAVLDVIAGM